jgi:hypothetical protein
MNRRFAHAVAFHGFNDERGVLIGGSAPSELKERVRQAIQGVLPTNLKVRVAGPDERYGGDDPKNIVNRLSPCGGIQIEQGATPREVHGQDIADAVADVFRPARSPDRHGARGILVQAWEQARATLDRLRGRRSPDRVREHLPDVPPAVKRESFARLGVGHPDR